MLITLEGIEGSGKTTQIEYMAAFLRGKGYDCAITKEPGGTGIGEKIRAILLDPGNDDIHPMTELMLYAADRVQHLKEFIIPMLESGKIVICDRFHDSTTVYQGVSRGVDLDVVGKLNKLVLEGIKPDITFILDLHPEIGLKRAWKQINDGSRLKSETRFEKEKLSFHQSVRKGFLELAAAEPERFVVVDGTADVSIVRDVIIKKIEELLKID